jgi:hypothetical protein
VKQSFKNGGDHESHFYFCLLGSSDHPVSTSVCPARHPKKNGLQHCKRDGIILVHVFHIAIEREEKQVGIGDDQDFSAI